MLMQVPPCTGSTALINNHCDVTVVSCFLEGLPTEPEPPEFTFRVR